jgi:hypothetical protein
MNDLILTRQLSERGLSPYDLERLIRLEELERVRRGAYGAPLPREVRAEARHRRLIMATVPMLQPGALVSHGSAAVLHGLPTWPQQRRRVHITRSRSSGGQRRSVVHLHVAPFSPDETTVIDGIAVTSLARTVLDLARTTPMHQSVAAGDRGLQLGIEPADLERGLAAMKSWPGVRRARPACGFLDPRSESAGESVSRVRFVEQDIPAPEVQYEVYDDWGKLLARCDFGWEEHRTLGEFDGKVKYGRLLRLGQRSEDVVFDEKLREDALRDGGWQVVRWTWGDLNHPEVIRDRLMRAFARTAGIDPSLRPRILS